MAKSNPVLSDPHRLDLHVVQDALRNGKASDLWLAGWLPATYAAPERFWEALYAYAASIRLAPSKSRLADAYDVYHDCVVAHLTRRRPAISAREREGEDWKETSYEGLHLRASAVAAAWTRAGVLPKQSVCVVMPIGLDYVVCAMAALKIGAVLSTLPPDGATYVRTRLEALSPDHVVALGRHRPLLGRFDAAVLPSTAPASTQAAMIGSHAYSDEDVVLRLLSPFQLEPEKPVEVTAAALHASLLRDGLLVYGLDASDTIAAPGFDSLQLQPHLILTSLMAGATYASIEPRDVDVDPKVTERLRVTVLGINRAVRESLLRPGALNGRPSERAWFRSLSDVLDTTRWDAIARPLSEKKILGFNVLANAASAGAHLFSPRALTAPSLRVWPAPGVTWQLSEVAAGLLPALNDTGVYTTLIEGKADRSLPRVILARLGDGYVYAGTMDLGPDAQVYPATEVAQVIERHPGVRHAAVIIAPGAAINEAKPVLLVFIDPPGNTAENDENAPPPLRIDALKSLIAREMGERYQPYRIEVFPLRPRMLEGVVDRAWCRSQYLAGAFTQKARMDLFVALAELGYIFAGAGASE